MGSNQGDILTSNNGANTLSGFPAMNFSMVAAATISSMEAGNDVAFLGAGNDVFEWEGDANDTVKGQDGVDRLDFDSIDVAENVDISAMVEHAPQPRH